MVLSVVEADPAAVRAAVYTRISSDDDAKVKQLGVKRQEAACAALVEARGWTLAGIYCDNNRSASKQGSDRPEFERLLADLGAGKVDRVVVLSQDRLVRKPDELELTMRHLRASGIAGIDTVTDGHVNIGTTSGRTMARVKGVFDIAYAEYISEKVSQKKDELAQRGLPAGGGTRAFGYEPDKLTVCPEEADLIREAAGRVLAGETIYAICADWNARGVKTVTGSKWVPATLRGVLVGPRVAGLREHRGEIVGDAAWDAILDRTTWEQVKALAYAPSRTRKGRPPRLLTGLLRCGQPGCGHPLLAGTNNGKRSYACGSGLGRPGCGKLAVIAEPVEELIVEAVLLATDSPRLAATVSGVTADADGAAVAALERRQAELAEMWAAGEMSRAEWNAARKVIEDKLNVERSKIAASAAAAVMSPYVAQPGLLRRQWPALADSQRREILATILKSVTVKPASVRGRHTFDPGRLVPVWNV